MSEATYWERRQQELNAACEKDEARLKDRLADYYRQEETRLQNEIAAYYTKYGSNNVAEYRQLLQQLSDSDYKLLMQRMDDFAKKYPEYAHLMPVRESIYKLDRLQGLQYSVQMQQLEMGIKEREEIEKHLMQQGWNNYDAIMRDLGFGINFNAENERLIRDIVNTAWCEGKNFSDRIWANHEKLSQMLQGEISQGFARGDKYERMVNALRKAFDVGRFEAFRLVYTEGTFVMNESRARACESTFEYYSIATADERACDECTAEELDTAGEPIRFSERVAGENFPPFHPFCRCAYFIQVKDEQAWIDNYVLNNGGDPILDDDARANAEEVLKRFSGEGTDSTLMQPIKSSDPQYDELLTRAAEKVDYNPVKNHTSPLTDEQIIAALGGGDQTAGSCASLGLAYIGQRQGWNVLDFRGGSSQEFFSSASNLFRLSHASGVSVLKADGKAAITVGKRLLKKCEVGKEYYLCCGRHAAIVRRNEGGVLQYLELQSPFRNGWLDFNGNPGYTLSTRFGCTSSMASWGDFMIDITSSDFSTDDFKSLLGYINTAEDKQEKGTNGTIK